MNSRAPIWIVSGLLLVAAVWGAWWLLSDDAGDTSLSGVVSEVVSPTETTLPPGVLPDALVTTDSDVVQRKPVPLETHGPITALEGRVVDRRGRPIAAANLQVFLFNGALALQPKQTSGPALSSGADGSFRITGVPANQPLGLEVRHLDHAAALKQPFTARIGDVTDLGDIVLRQGLKLVGRIVDDGGRPLEGARVAIIDLTALVPEGSDGPAERETFSDYDGQYMLDHLSMRRQFAVTASLEGYASMRITLSFVLDIPDDSWKQNFTLEVADQMLGGVVLDEEGRPQADVQLTISRSKRGSNSYFQQTLISDVDGRFLFESVPDDRFGLRVVAPFAYLASTPKLESGRTDHEVWLRHSLGMHGRLTATGSPPANFTVKALPDARTGALLVPGADAVREFRATDPPGSFRFDGLKPGTWFFQVTAPGFAVTKSSSLILGDNAPDPELLISLFRGGEVVGHLNQPLAGVPVELRPGGYDPSLSIESIFPTRPVHGLATVTDDKGYFRIEHVPEETYTVSLMPPGQPPLHVRHVEIREGGVTDVGGLELPEACHLTGRVTWDDEELSPPFKITATGGASFQNVLTDDAGAFELTALQPGEYKLTATPQGFFEAIRWRGDAKVTLSSGDAQQVVIPIGHSVPPAARRSRGG